MFENDRTTRPTRIGTERKLSVLTEIVNEHPSSRSLNSEKSEYLIYNHFIVFAEHVWK